MENKCLYCYKKIEREKGYIHKSCSKKFFGIYPPPELNYTEDEMEELALKVVSSQISVTGVQAKLSLDISQEKEAPSRFTIVGLWGQYILKPPTREYNNLPEIEDLTMKLASTCKIKTVPHSLIRLKSGSLAYITKRVDRDKDEKIHMEDMCQLTERLTEHKYSGSHEQIAKRIKMYCKNSGLEVFAFFELVLFSFLTGNADMHLKNFSLIYLKNIGYTLCPAYDLVATALVVPDDEEELALNLNGKKRKIKRKDFEIAMKTAEIPDKAIEAIFKRMAKNIHSWFPLIEDSFMPSNLKVEYCNLIMQKAKQLGMSIQINKE